MHPIDTMLLTNVPLTHIPEPKPTEAASPGESYYWDRRAEGHTHEQAAALARRDVRQAVRAWNGVRRA